MYYKNKKKKGKGKRKYEKQWYMQQLLIGSGSGKPHLTLHFIRSVVEDLSKQRQRPHFYCPWWRHLAKGGFHLEAGVKVWEKASCHTTLIENQRLLMVFRRIIVLQERLCDFGFILLKMVSYVWKPSTDNLKNEYT